MLGTGRANVAQVCDLARANVADGLPAEALLAFSSLGSGGRHSGNQERDLHRWLHSLFGLKLAPYKVRMHLNVSSQVLVAKFCFESMLFCHPCFYNGVCYIQSYAFASSRPR